MNEAIATVGSNALVLDSPEDALNKEASLIEQKASSVAVTNDAEYAAAGELTKAVKQMQKKVKEYWEPLRDKRQGGLRRGLEPQEGDA